MERFSSAKTFRSTLDLDYWTKDMIEHILLKIPHMCDGFKNIMLKESHRKGYHITLYCYVDCDFCRFIYDDPHRYYADLTNRKPYERDVLWQRKKPYKNLRTFLRVLNTRHTNR